VLELKNFTWTEYPSCEKPGVGCNLVIFNEDYVFKFGGSTITGKPLNIVGFIKVINDRLKN